MTNIKPDDLCLCHHVRWQHKGINQYKTGECSVCYYQGCWSFVMHPSVEDMTAEIKKWTWGPPWEQERP